MLRKYMSDPSHVLEIHPVELRDNMTYKVQPEAIMERQVRKLRSKDIASVKVMWNNHSCEEALWELEDKMLEAGQKRLRREGRDESRWVLLDFGDLVVHVFHEEERVFYGLERLWKDCPIIPVTIAEPTPSE